MSPLETKSGFVALVGRPNAGKSTLTNAAVGTKVAITSDTPQTTRHRLRAVLDRDDAQIVIVDTPGLHKPYDALGEELNRSALKALEDVDVVALLIDATKPVGEGDRWVAAHVAKSRGQEAPRHHQGRPRQGRAGSSAARRGPPARRLRRRGRALGGLRLQPRRLRRGGRSLPAERARAGFPRDMPTDQSVETMIAEFVREKILRMTHDEVPHAVGVAIDELEFVEKKDLTRIFATDLRRAGLPEGHPHRQGR